MAALTGSHTATLGWLVPGLLSYDGLIFTILDSDCIYILLLVYVIVVSSFSWVASLYGVLPFGSS